MINTLIGLFVFRVVTILNHHITYDGAVFMFPARVKDLHNDLYMYVNVVKMSVRWGMSAYAPEEMK